MSSESCEEKEAKLKQEDDEHENIEEATLDEREALRDDESLESAEDGDIVGNRSFRKERHLGEDKADEGLEETSSRSRSQNKRKLNRNKVTLKEDSDDSSNESDSQSDEEPELLQSTDSDTDIDQSTFEPKTLEKLGITLNKSERIWNSHKALRSREFGNGVPHLFSRNVTGSLNMVQKFKLERKLEFHAGCVNTLNFNATGDLLASGSDDLNIVLWDWAKGKKRFHYESGHTGNVFQAKFMPNTNDSIVVSCARDGQVRAGYLSSLRSCIRTKRLAQHRDGAHKLSIEPGSPNVLMTCGEDGQVIEIDLRKENGYRRLLCRGDQNVKVSLYSIFINPTKHEEFAVGGRDHKCRVYDRRHMKEDIKEKIQPLKLYFPHEFENKESCINITCLVYSHDGSELLVSYNDEDIYLFDANSSSNAEHTHRYRGHRNNMTVKGVNFYGPRSEFIVSGSDCGHVFLWDKETESVVQLLEGDEAGVVNCLEPHPFHPFLATSGLDHDVKIWTPTSDNPVDFEKVKSVILSNDRERYEERSRPNPFPGDLLMYMVNHIARQRNLSAMDDEEDGNEEEDSSSDENGERVQCYPS